MQNQIDLLIAYANKIALNLSIKEHSINKRVIQKQGRTIYALNMLHSHCLFRKYSGTDGQYNSRQENSLCNTALQMVQMAMKLDELFTKRGKLLIESTFSQRVTSIKEENENKGSIIQLPFQSFNGLDIHLKSAKQKIRHFVLANYRRSPHQINKLVKSLALPVNQVKMWIQYHEKSERRIKLREQVVQFGLHRSINFQEFKKIARKIYKTKLFRATDSWCLNYIRKFRLEHIIEIPQNLLQQ